MLVWIEFTEFPSIKLFAFAVSACHGHIRMWNSFSTDFMVAVIGVVTHIESANKTKHKKPAQIGVEVHAW